MTVAIVVHSVDDFWRVGIDAGIGVVAVAIFLGEPIAVDIDKGRMIGTARCAQVVASLVVVVVVGPLRIAGIDGRFIGAGIAWCLHFLRLGRFNP